MASTKYTYSISSDTANGAVVGGKLQGEINGNKTITVAVDYISTDGDVLDVWMLAALSAGEQTELGNVVAAHDGQPVVVIDQVELSSPKTSLGFPKFELEPPEGSKTEFISINWCDKTTWYPNSVQVVDEVLTDSGDQLTYNPAQARPWIDVTHAKITGEWKIESTYAPVIKVNDVVQTENSAGVTPVDGDYDIDYQTGAVTFNSALQGGDVVKATYHYATDSTFKIKPNPGKLIRLTYVEVQFSENIDLKDDFVFESYGPVELYAPTLWDGYSPPGPYPAGTMIPLGEAGGKRVYKSMQDFINEAEETYVSIPKMGGTSHRGMKGPVHIFRWPYVSRSTTDIPASSQTEIWLRCKNDTVHGGDIAIATFYGKTQDE